MFLLLGCFPLLIDGLPFVLVFFNPDLYSFNRYMTIEQRYTYVALNKCKNQNSKQVLLRHILRVAATSQNPLLVIYHICVSLLFFTMIQTSGFLGRIVFHVVFLLSSKK